MSVVTTVVQLHAVESVYINLPMADLEGVPWVPWNPIFEGLS